VTQMMRAVVADAPGGPEVLQVRQLPVPEPGPGEVRLRVAYASMNPMDTFARQGLVPWLRVPWPFVPGIEHAGVVDKVGPGVDPTMIGKRYHSRNYWGGNADYSVAPLANVAPMAEGLDWRVGTCYAGMTYTAYHALHTAARMRAGDWCLFHSAAGPIGIMLAQIAKEARGHVIGLCSARKFDYARPFGFDHLIDYGVAGWDKQVMEITKGLGVDVIVDGNQGPEADKNYEVVAPGGHVIYIGATAGAPAPDVSPRKMIYKSAFMGGFNLTVLEKRRGDARDNALVLERIRSGRWTVPISEEVTLEQVPDLHRRFARREIKGRVVVRVGGELNHHG